MRPRKTSSSPLQRIRASWTKIWLLVLALLVTVGLTGTLLFLGSATDKSTALAPKIAVPFEKEAEPATGKADDPEGRANWFMFQRMYPFNEIPEGARRRAWDEVLARGEGIGPDAVGTTWAPIGPLPTTSAFPNNGGVTSGRINSIAVSPANNQIVLVGSATGGIWRSTNGGTTFTPVSDGQADLAVGAIAFAPSNGNIVYAGMGDLDNRYFGTGVLKSTDAGATWTRINAGGFPDRGNCVAVQVDPNDPNKVYVAQYNYSNPATNGTFVSGIYVSTNGGVNWTNTLGGLASDIVIHPTNSQILYAGLRFSFGAGIQPGLYKSTNGGTSWTRVYDSPYTANQSSTREFRVAVTPANPNRVYVYYGTSGQVRLDMSNDAGATWTDRGVIPAGAGGIDPGQFGYNTYLAASPTDANTVYVGSRDVFQSTDGGLNFTNINNSFAAPYPNGAYTPRLQKFHADQQSFAFQPGSGTTFYCGNDGGLWKTTNGGTSFTSLNTTLSLTQFVGFGLNPVDATKSYGGAQDNGSQRRTAGTAWHEFSGGDGGKLVINPADPTMIFHSYVEGSITRNLNHGATYDGNIADPALLGEPTVANGGRIAFYPPIVGNGVDHRIYVGTYRLLRCDTCNDTNVFIGGIAPIWTAPGGTFDQTNGDGDILSAIAVAKSNNQVIYTGSRGGRAMVSTNGGANWTDVTTGLPTRSIANITVSATDPTRVFLTVSGYGSGHVFRSTNSGGTWTDISANLPNIPTSAFLIDPLTPTTLYAGTDIGVFRSTDNGAAWAAFNNGLPPVPVMEFSAQANGLIQIGTYGRGAYELATVTQTGRTPFDFDGDRKSDISVYRPSNGIWYLDRSQAGFFGINFGNSTDKLVPADYDGDGKTDVAVYRPLEGIWYIVNSSNGANLSFRFGLAADVPAPADYDGDGKADLCVFRPSDGTWYRQNSGNGSFFAMQFGAAGDKPTIGDFDGDGKADIALYRPSNGAWYQVRSANGAIFAEQFGFGTDVIVPADYDGDGKTDLAVYRASEGIWYVKASATSAYLSYRFGLPPDIPAPGDFDGDGKADLSIFRPGEGNWYRQNSANGSFNTFPFGVNGDRPTQSAFQ